MSVRIGKKAASVLPEAVGAKINVLLPFNIWGIAFFWIEFKSFQPNLLDKKCNIYKQGKNWYCEIDNIKITINSYSYTIITAHKKF